MPNCIKSIHIEGFKKFQQFDMSFNEKMNILVGENEAGKTTILEAIKLVLNQGYRLADKSYLEDLFNKDLVQHFEDNPCLENLPQIRIDLEFGLDDKAKNSEIFFGEHNAKEVAAYGISFICKFDEESWGDAIDFSQTTEVPYEFYNLEWKNFSGKPYNPLIRPVHFLTMDTSKIDRASSFNYYNRTVLHSVCEEGELLSKKNAFRSAIGKHFQEIQIGTTENNRSFGIDSKKIVLDNIISILQDGVSLENHGSGMENLIKTEISLSRAAKMNVIMLEEPENHLSFANLQKMIDTIEQANENTQIIIATHSSMIATRLDLRNVFWITEGKANSLQNVKESDAKFFIKLARNSFLQMLLAKKVIFVEGITEYLLLPEFYKYIYGHDMKQDDITIISCEGVTYGRYLSIIDATDKCAVAITDNDANREKSKNKLERIAQENLKYQQAKKNYYIFTSKNKAYWTWEICLYEQGNNKKIINEYLKKKNSLEIKNNEDYRNYFESKGAKTEFAYSILLDNLIGEKKLEAPDYVKEAFEWVRR